MTASILDKSGVYFENSMPRNQYNPSGFWESSLVDHLNDKLLLFLGGTRDRLPPLPIGWETIPALESLRKHANDYLVSIRAETYGIKDPAMSITLPFWKPYLDNPHYVICIRNPLATVSSWARVDHEDPMIGMKLWYAYTMNAIRNTKGGKRMILHYEDYFENPQDQIRKLCDFVEVSYFDDTQRLVAPGLQRFKSELDKLLSKKGVIPQVKHLYLLLLAERQDGSVIDKVEKIPVSDIEVQASLFFRMMSILRWKMLNGSAAGVLLQAQKELENSNNGGILQRLATLLRG